MSSVAMLLVLPVLTVLAVAWVALVAAAPELPATIAGPIYLFGSTICHQIAERSFHLDGVQLPVCARCFGIYAGAACGALLSWPGHRSVNGASFRRVTNRLALAIACVPTVMTLGLEWAGLWQPSNVARASAGVILGAVVAFVTMRALHYEHQCLRRSNASVQRPTPI